jgi:hypothetical protein
MVKRIGWKTTFSRVGRKIQIETGGNGVGYP